MVRVLVLAFVSAVPFVAMPIRAAMPAPAAAPVPSCRGYPSANVVAHLKRRVEALRRVEREAADRILGRDTRPYEWLLEQAQAAHAAITDPAALAAEGDWQRCRNFIRPVRRDCATGAAALVRVVTEL